MRNGYVVRTDGKALLIGLANTNLDLCYLDEPSTSRAEDGEIARVSYFENAAAGSWWCRLADQRLAKTRSRGWDRLAKGTSTQSIANVAAKNGNHPIAGNDPHYLST